MGRLETSAPKGSVLGVRRKADVLGVRRKADATEYLVH